MNHKTTVAYSINVNQDIDEIINEIIKLKHYLIEKDADWGFELQVDKIIYKGTKISNYFDEFVQYLKENAYVAQGDDGNDFINFRELGKYVIQAGGPEDSFGSLEDGNVKFNNSIIIISDEVPIDEYSQLSILIYVNIPGYFANELSPNDEGLGIEAEAADVDGYHFEFII